MLATAVHVQNVMHSPLNMYVVVVLGLLYVLYVYVICFSHLMASASIRQKIFKANCPQILSMELGPL